MSVPGRHEINAHEVARRIGEILHYLWDPIGVRGIPEARDEYDSYVAHVGALLERGASEEEIAACLTYTATQTMGLSSTQAMKTHDRETAKLLIQHHRFLKERQDGEA